jgi:uncharacterized protein YtpQ (UPF0354 family)
LGLLDMFGRKPDRDRFADEVVDRLKRRGWSPAPRRTANGFAIDLGGGNALNLDNAFNDWSKASGTGRNAIVDHVVNTAFDLKEDKATFQETAPHLIPVIRNRSQLQSQWLDPALKMGVGAFDGAFVPICDSLAVLVAIDRASSITTLNANAFDEWGHPFEEVLALAMENLGAHGRCAFERAAEGYFVSAYGDDYDASRILLPHLFELLSLKGDPVAVVVSRSCVVVAGSDDLPALAAMAAFVEQRLGAETRPVSMLPIVYGDGAWSAFRSARPELAATDLLGRRQDAWDYANQKAMMESRFAADGRDVFVAGASAATVDGRFVTMSSWAREVVTLLPKTDVVILQNAGRDSGLVRAWADVWEICGPLAEEPGYYPPRYLVEASPTSDQWARLEATPPPPLLPNRLPTKPVAT